MFFIKPVRSSGLLSTKQSFQQNPQDAETQDMEVSKLSDASFTPDSKDPRGKNLPSS